jgi:hypothetical protein
VIANADVPSQGPIETPNRKKEFDTNPNGPIRPATRVAAPENSEFANSMDKQGHFLEERYFVANKYLTQAERTWLAPGESTVKVWLKNGRQVSIPGEKISDLKNIPIENLLALAGVKVAPPPPPKPEKNPQKLQMLKQAQ